MPASPPPFRAEHVGSLLRPGALKRGFRDRRRGELSEARFRDLQDRAIRGAVAMQEEVGLQSITDGEFRRASYWAPFVEAVEGLEVREALYDFRDGDGETVGFMAPHVAGKVRRNRGIATEEFAFLRSATSRTPKVTLPSPPTLHFWRLGRGMAPVAYDSVASFFHDLAQVYRAELAALGGLGATYVQLDDVPLAMLCDPDVQARVRAAGEDPDALATQYVEAINLALADRPPAMTAALHLCRGNFKGRWLSEGGYEAVAERLFGALAADAFFLEYDSPRAGDFAPLRFVPSGKTVVLGLVSSKTPVRESAADLCRRIEEAARIVPLDRLSVSPQCGFASTVAGNPLTIDDQRSKLALVVEVARLMWG